MIRSMTGYGRGSAELPGLRVSVELRSVNNRYTDLRFRLPPTLAGLEPELRRRVRSQVGRGRVELTVKLEAVAAAPDRVPGLNRPLLEQVLEAGVTLRNEYGLEGSLRVDTVLGFPGMLKSDPTEGSAEEALAETVLEAVELGIRDLDRDRVREGQELQKELCVRVSNLQRLLEGIRTKAGEMPQRLLDRLRERLEALGSEVDLDPQRVAQEAALLAERHDVTEELVRLEGHLRQAHDLLSTPDGEPVGRRLEFLVQEIQREANTLSSKSPDLELTRSVLAAKGEAEKVREQAQNLE